MTELVMVYLVMAAAVALWFMVPPERDCGTGPLQALASGALWPLLVLCLSAVALLFWVFPEEEVPQGAPSAEPDGHGAALRRPGADGVAALPLELGQRP